MLAPPGSLLDLLYHYPVLACASAVGAITVTRKTISKGLQALLEIFRAFCDFLLGVETVWREYQNARPQKNGDGCSKNRLAVPQIK